MTDRILADHLPHLVHQLRLRLKPSARGHDPPELLSILAKTGLGRPIVANTKPISNASQWE